MARGSRSAGPAGDPGRRTALAGATRARAAVTRPGPAPGRHGGGRRFARSGVGAGGRRIGGGVLERLALVPRAGAAAWGAVVAALLDAIDVVLVRPPARLSAAVARRLAARARERRSVLLLVGAGWPIPPDLRLAVTASQWEGLGQGDGRLEARKVEVAAAGRGAAVLERRAKLWLPSPDAQQGAGPRHDRYVRAVEEGMDSRVVRPWKGREVDTTSAASKSRLLQSV